MSKPYLSVNDFTKDFFAAIKTLKEKQTLVGIPSKTSDRKPEPGEAPEPINNAALLYINEFGSPTQNIPARHPMKTGIKIAQDALADEFRKCAKAAFTHGEAALDQYYERIGIIGSQSVKYVIYTQQDMDPISDATSRSRQSRGFKGEKALIVTGQMRNAITYVVVRK